MAPMKPGANSAMKLFREVKTTGWSATVVNCPPSLTAKADMEIRFREFKRATPNVVEVVEAPG